MLDVTIMTSWRNVISIEHLTSPVFLFCFCLLLFSFFVERMEIVFLKTCHCIVFTNFNTQIVFFQKSEPLVYS